MTRASEFLAIGLLALVSVSCDKPIITFGDKNDNDSEAVEVADDHGGATKEAAPLPITRVVAPSGPTYFLPLTFAEAATRAGELGRTVFVYFYSNADEGCTAFEREVLTDPRVTSLLRRTTVPIRINIAENQLVASMYGVRMVPDCLFQLANGTAIERLRSVLPADTFYSWAGYYALGMDNVAIARERVYNARSQLADSLIEKRYYDDAMAEYLWVWDQARALDPQFLETRGPHLAHRLGQLARGHLPTRKEIERRRDAAEQRLLLGEGTHMSIRILSDLNAALGQPEATIALYDRFRRERSDDPLASEWNYLLFDTLREAHRYQDIAARSDFLQVIDELFRTAGRDQPLTDEYATQQEFSRAMALHKSYLANYLAKHYEVLLGVGRTQEAEALETRMLEVAPGQITLNALAWAGYLTGKPTEQHLEQARRAYELSRRRSPAILDTLARIMALHGQQEEALSLIDYGIRSVGGQEEKRMLRRCLADITTPSASPEAPAIVGTNSIPDPADK
ncbi:MAG: hypothetical protein GY842_07740 [bacterium]|nr:hypothetical protein [bacterium]